MRVLMRPCSIYIYFKWIESRNRVMLKENINFFIMVNSEEQCFLHRSVDKL